MPAPISGNSSASRSPRVIVLEEFRIEGRVQKPNAFYVLQRAGIGWETRGIAPDLVPQIFRDAGGLLREKGIE